MGYNMVIYGLEYSEDEDIFLKRLMNWKNHYLLNDWFIDYFNLNGDCESLFFKFYEDCCYDLQDDCAEAINFISDHVTSHRLNISDDDSLVSEWEYNWDCELPDNPFFKIDFRFYLGRYGCDGFIYLLERIIDFINEYINKYDVFVYEVI